MTTTPSRSDAASPGAASSGAKKSGAAPAADAGAVLTTEHLRSIRLAALGLRGSSVPGSQSETVDALAQVGRRFLAMQGQDFAAARWALGQRVPGATHSDVRAVLDSGLLVRSWPMRGTLHVVPGEDIGWVQDLTAERVTGASAQRRRNQLGLDLSVIEQAREIAVEVLEGHRALSRDELVAVWQDRLPELRAEWKYHLVWFLAQTGTLCLGPMLDDREQALVLVDEWVPEPRRLDREEALVELARRYVQSHGAVTLKDFVWWTGLPQRDLKLGLAGLGDAVTTVRGEDGADYHVDAEALETVPDVPAEGEGGAPHVLLLPAFDEYLLGYGDRSATLDPAHAPQVCPGGNGVFRPTVVVDGVTLGTWKREPARAKDPGPRLTVLPFDARSARRLRSRAVKAPLAAAARRYGRFRQASSGAGADDGPPVEVTVAAP